MSNEYAGGAKTNENGLKYEASKDVLKMLQNDERIRLEPHPKFPKVKNLRLIFFNDEFAGYWFKQYGLYRLLQALGIEWSDHCSKKYLPDDAIIWLAGDSPAAIFFEKKFQMSAGSVDEKVSNGMGKHHALSGLMLALNIQRKDFYYEYILSTFFRHKRYNDVRQYYGTSLVKEYGELIKNIFLHDDKVPSLSSVLKRLTTGAYTS